VTGKAADLKLPTHLSANRAQISQMPLTRRLSMFLFALVHFRNTVSLRTIKKLCLISKTIHYYHQYPAVPIAVSNVTDLRKPIRELELVFKMTVSCGVAPHFQVDILVTKSVSASVTSVNLHRTTRATFQTELFILAAVRTSNLT
jgi:hypothetical protein